MKAPTSATMALMVTISLSGCATVIDGTSQNISVATDPPGASCDLVRQGEVVGSVVDTPNMISVRKSKYDVLIRCRKPGYHEAVYVDRSGNASEVSLNVVVDAMASGGIFSALDSADGADNKYNGRVTLTLVPESGALSSPSPTVASEAPSR